MGMTDVIEFVIEFKFWLAVLSPFVIATIVLKIIG